MRDTFSLPKLGVVAGCHVVEGVIPRNAGARLLRDNIVIYEGKIASARFFARHALPKTKARREAAEQEDGWLMDMPDSAF